jgi:hypothetical protein
MIYHLEITCIYIETVGSIKKVTGSWLEDEGSVPASYRDFSLFCQDQTISGHDMSEAGHLPSSSTKVENTRMFTSTSYILWYGA